MAQMPTTITAHNLRPGHPEHVIHMPRHSTGYTVEICRPSAAAFELVGCFVEGGVAAGTCVDASGGHVLVVLSGVGGFGTLFAEDAELF